MEVFVARQPIFDCNQKVVFYELLFRHDQSNNYEALDGDLATLDVITNSFFCIGIDNLTGGKKAFINFTDNLLKSDMMTILPKEHLAIEILETVEPTEEIINACRNLKSLGYTLVLDDFVFSYKYEPLIELADIIKVDFLLTSPYERERLINNISNKKVEFLAEKVETREEFEEAVRLGYTYFQGYFFSKPMIMTGTDLPAQKLQYLNALKDLNKPNLNFEDIEKIIKRDVALSYKLLRYINSSSFGFISKVHSIRQAIALIGEDEVIRWISVIVFKETAVEKNNEALTTCIVRARFGEIICSMNNDLKSKASDVFFMGMFSMIDSLINRPIEEILGELPMDSEVKDALMGKRNTFRDIYELIICYERGRWERLTYYSNKLKLDERRLPEIYLDSLNWSKELLF
jgi:EAL and modified HD-GYP domain-containing signal transduction protein